MHTPTPDPPTRAERQILFALAHRGELGPDRPTGAAHEPEVAELAERAHGREREEGRGQARDAAPLLVDADERRHLALARVEDLGVQGPGMLGRGQVALEQDDAPPAQNIPSEGD